MAISSSTDSWRRQTRKSDINSKHVWRIPSLLLLVSEVEPSAYSSLIRKKKKTSINMQHVRYVDICRVIFLYRIFLSILIMVPVSHVMDSEALQHSLREISSALIFLCRSEPSFHGQLTLTIVPFSMLYVSMRRSMRVSRIRVLQKKNEKKFSIECQAHSKYPIYRSMMRENPTEPNMSDLSRILNADIRNQIWEMMHFSKESRTSLQNKYVELVTDIDWRRSTFLYWYEEKILANWQISLSKNQRFFSILLFLRKKNLKS